MEAYILQCDLRYNDKAQTTLHGFAVDLLSICWRRNGFVYSMSVASRQACCRLAVDLSVGTKSNGFAVDLLATQRVCLQHLDTSRCCRQIRCWHNAVDFAAHLLATP
jgi:hypothetical protein